MVEVTYRHRVGFIGLGNMGRPMAARLAAEGFPLVVYDVRRDAAAKLLQNGATWADSPRSVAEQVDGITIHLTDRKSIELLTPTAADKALIGFDLPMHEGAGYLCSVTFLVRDFARTADYLATTGIDFRQCERRTIRVNPRDTCGVLLEFTELTGH